MDVCGCSVSSEFDSYCSFSFFIFLFGKKNYKNYSTPIIKQTVTFQSVRGVRSGSGISEGTDPVMFFRLAATQRVNANRPHRQQTARLI